MPRARCTCTSSPGPPRRRVIRRAGAEAAPPRRGLRCARPEGFVDGAGLAELPRQLDDEGHDTAAVTGAGLRQARVDVPTEEHLCDARRGSRDAARARWPALAAAPPLEREPCGHRGEPPAGLEPLPGPQRLRPAAAAVRAPMLRAPRARGRRAPPAAPPRRHLRERPTARAARASPPSRSPSPSTSPRSSAATRLSAAWRSRSRSAAAVASRIPPPARSSSSRAPAARGVTTANAMTDIVQ